MTQQGDVTQPRYFLALLHVVGLEVFLSLSFFFPLSPTARTEAGPAAGREAGVTQSLTRRPCTPEGARAEYKRVTRLGADASATCSPL